MCIFAVEFYSKNMIKSKTSQKPALLIGNRKNVTGYHSQECRELELERPLKCTDRKAWLGFGFYFLYLENQIN